jgi:hypothetical protein
MGLESHLENNQSEVSYVPSMLSVSTKKFKFHVEH